ncbi:TPA: hypothetical protein HA318_04275 [Candidatus Micrarchaeota archaeon]|nr:MAG: hypothetical protein AUJ65_01730 [Candidatus Micrarchaeota archaeon CG1_02_51_15]HII39188.1 hypothetical protein [Candidatus Micrarchaeota archaeon]
MFEQAFLPALLYTDFGEAFGLVALILVFFTLYNLLSNNFIRHPLLALLVTALIIFLLVLPYDWFKYLLFAVLVMYGLFTVVDPKKWF